MVVATIACSLLMVASSMGTQAQRAFAMYVDWAPGAAGGSLFRVVCPSGFVCLWPGETVQGVPQPEHKYYYYATYPLIDEWGGHTIWNNQTGGAEVVLCYDARGTRCSWLSLEPGQAWHGDLDPFNSIKLVP